MSFTMLSTTILIVAVMLVCGKAVSGYKAGATRSLADLALLIASASLGAVISVLMASVVGDSLYGSVTNMEFYRDIVEQIGDIRSLALILTGMVGAVILFVPIFFIIYGIGSAILAMVFKTYACDISDKGNEQSGETVSFYAKNGKTIGAAVGSVCGFLILIAIFTPLAGILKNTTALVDALEECMETQIIDDSETESFFSYSDDVMISVVYEAGGKAIFDTLTLVEHGGRITSLSHEIEVLESIRLNEIAEIIEDVVEGDAKDAEMMLTEAKKSVFVEALMHMSVRSAAESWLSGESYLGVPRPSFGEGRMFDNFLNEILFVCSQSELDTFSDNMITLINVNGIFAEKRSALASGDYNVIAKELADGGLLDELRAEFEKNPNMQRVVYAIDDMVMTMIVDEVNSSKHSEYNRETLYRRLANAMNQTQHQTDEERVNSIAEFVSSAFEEYNAYLPESLSDDIATVLIERIDSFGTVRARDIQDLFWAYVK